MPGYQYLLAHLIDMYDLETVSFIDVQCVYVMSLFSASQKSETQPKYITIFAGNSFCCCKIICDGERGVREYGRNTKQKKAIMSTRTHIAIHVIYILFHFLVHISGEFSMTKKQISKRVCNKKIYMYEP